MNFNLVIVILSSACLAVVKASNPYYNPEATFKFALKCETPICIKQIYNIPREPGFSEYLHKLMEGKVGVSEMSNKIKYYLFDSLHQAIENKDKDLEALKADLTKMKKTPKKYPGEIEVTQRNIGVLEKGVPIYEKFLTLYKNEEVKVRGTEEIKKLIEENKKKREEYEKVNGKKWFKSLMTPGSTLDTIYNTLNRKGIQ